MSKIFLLISYLSNKQKCKNSLNPFSQKSITKNFSFKSKISQKTKNTTKLTKDKKDFKDITKETKENIQSNTKEESTNIFNKKSHMENSKPSNESIFLFSHDSAKKYYLLNFSLLSVYTLLCSKIANDPEYPDFLRHSLNGFIGLTTFGLVAILFFAKRHVYSIYLQRPSNILLIKTYSKFGLGNKQYQLPVSEIKEMISIDRKFKKLRTGIYMIKPTQKYQFFRIINVFFIRPQKQNNYMFDEIFAKKLKK